MLPFTPTKRGFLNGKLSPEQKLIAVQRIQNGETKAGVAREVNVPESTLRGWCKNVAKIQYLVQQNQIIHNPPPTIMPQQQIQSNASNEWPTLEYYKSSGSGDSMGVVDFNTSTNDRIQSYGSFSSASSSGTGMELTKSRLNLPSPSAPPLNHSQPNVENSYPWQRQADQNISASIPTSNYSARQLFGSSGPYYHSPIQSTSLPNQPMMTPQMAAPLPNDSKQPILWQFHDFNQSVIEKIASPTSSEEFKFCLPEGLSIRPNPVVQPSLLPVQSIGRNHPASTGYITVKSEPCIDQKADIVSEKALNFDNRHHSASTGYITVKSEPCIDQEPDIESEKVLNFNNSDNNNTDNNNCSVAENQKTNDDIMDPSVAIQYAEKFSKWFQTYSDPTLTTQDVMRFEQLLTKVRKIVERRNFGAVQRLHLKNKRK